MKHFCGILLFFYSSIVFSQLSTTNSFSSWGKTDVYVGFNQGAQPNLRNGRLNAYSGINTSFSVKNLPFNLNARISNEEFLSSKASYFRLSYNGVKYKSLDKRKSEYELAELNKEIGKLKDSLASLDAKVGYLKFKLDEKSLNSFNKLTGLNLNQPNLANQRFVIDSTSLNGNIKTEFERPDLQYIDSLNQLINTLNTSKTELENLLSKQLEEKTLLINKIQG